jgi:membrane-associated phospholipid phosphatase
MATQQDAAPASAADDGRVRERGWAPVRHFTERSIFGLIAVVLLGVGFGVLLLLVRFHWGPLQRLDAQADNGLNELVAPHPGLVAALKTVAGLGGRGFMIPLVAVALVVLLIRRRPRLAIYLVITTVGALVLDPSLKTLVGRLRPMVDVPVATGGGNSFPSGHALGSIVTYGALLLVFLPAVPQRWRKPAIGLTAAIVLAIGITRVALGVHYISDVLAGWLLGAAWLGVTAYAFRVWRREAGHSQAHVDDGLEPEAGPDMKPAAGERRLMPHPWAGAAEILTGWVLIFGLLYVTGYAFTHYTEGTWLGSFDDGVPRWLQTFRTPALDSVSQWWSKAGDTHAILAVSLVFCPIALAAWRQWRPVLFLVLAMFGELSLFLCSAAAVDRPRPPVQQLDEQLPTSSFPSGHIAATLCLWISIALLVTARTRHWWRWIFVALAVIMPVGVALSRMYRGEHHPTDVLGAVLLAALWLTVLWWTVRPNAEARTVSQARAVAEAARPGAALT